MPHAPQPLLIIGASARAAAQSAARAGYEVTAIDLFSDDDLAACAKVQRSHNYPHDLPALAATCADGPWLYTGGLENHPAIVDEISRARPLLGNGPETLQQVRDPVALQAALAKRSLPCVPTQFSATGVPRDGTWLRKPLRSSGGSQIQFFRRNEPSNPSLPSDRYYYQHFIAGSSAAAIFVADGRRRTLLGITEQLIGSPWSDRPFQYAGSIGPFDVSPSVRKQIIACGAALAEEFSLRGLFGIDGVICANSNKFYTVEVNPRYTASCEVVEANLSHESDRANLIALHIAACAKKVLSDVSDERGQRRAHGKLIVYSRRTLVVAEALRTFIEHTNQTGNCRIADIPPLGVTIDRGRPAFTLLSSGATAIDVFDELANLRRQIEMRYC